MSTPATAGPINRAEFHEVAFRATGGVAQLARLIVASPFRRRFLRRGLARVEGDREAVAAAAAILDMQLDFGQLPTAGVRLEPRLALELAASMVRRL